MPILVGVCLARNDSLQHGQSLFTQFCHIVLFKKRGPFKRTICTVAPISLEQIGW
jgi:hypothetical protein